MSVTIHCGISLEKACIIHVTTTYGIHIPCLHAQYFEQGFHCSTDFKYFLIDAHLIAHVKFCMDISVMLSDEDIKLNKFCCELSFEDEAILKFLITLNLTDLLQCIDVLSISVTDQAKHFGWQCIKVGQAHAHSGPSLATPLVTIIELVSAR